MASVHVEGPSEKALLRAITRFADVLDDSAVVTEDAVAEGHDPYAFDGGRDHQPSAILYPSTVEQVQQVVKIADAEGIPLWVVSRGKNLGYGGMAPRVSGSVVVNLSRMNRILEVNDTMCYALVEPGVTFFDLYNYVRENDLKVWTSVPGLGWGSVVGNTLERGFGYTAYGDHQMQQCGLEVVLADGEIIRTGMGANANSAAWQLYKPGFGPSLDGLFQQSNLGIVTKMGLWMMPRPERFVSVEAKIESEDTLSQLVETLRPLMVDGTISGLATIRSALHLIAKLTTRKQLWSGAGGVPDDVVQSARSKYGVGGWNLSFGLYGAACVVQARLDVACRALEKLPGIELSFQDYDGADVSEETVAPKDLHRAGIPNMLPLRAMDWAGKNGGTLAFAPVSPTTGADAKAQYDMIRRYVREYGFDYYGSFNVSTRHMNHVLQIFFDRDSPRDLEALAAMMPRMMDEAADKGYSEYRAHLSFMDDVSDGFTFNKNALRGVIERLKDVLDPKGIISPGKQGIWPSLMVSRAKKGTEEL